MPWHHGTQHLFSALVTQTGLLTRGDLLPLLLALFGHRPLPGHRPFHITFVGQALLTCIGHGSMSQPEDTCMGWEARISAVESWQLSMPVDADGFSDDAASE